MKQGQREEQKKHRQTDTNMKIEWGIKKHKNKNSKQSANHSELFTKFKGNPPLSMVTPHPPVSLETHLPIHAVWCWVKPAGHLQVKPPMVFTHRNWQLCCLVEHSSKSRGSTNS